MSTSNCILNYATSASVSPHRPFSPSLRFCFERSQLSLRSEDSNLEDFALTAHMIDISSHS